jgi:hypothetical protein
VRVLKHHAQVSDQGKDSSTNRGRRQVRVSPRPEGNTLDELNDVVICGRIIFEMAVKDNRNVVAVGGGSPATTVAMLTMSFTAISKTTTVAATAATRDLHPGC